VEDELHEMVTDLLVQLGDLLLVILHLFVQPQILFDDLLYIVFVFISPALLRPLQSLHKSVALILAFLLIVV
jgi:hypothetical protein